MNTSRDKDEKNNIDDYTEYYDDNCDYYEDEEIINIIEEEREEDAGATGGPPPRRLNPLECYYCGHLSSNSIAVAKHMISGHWDEVRERQGAGRRDNSNYYNNIDLDSRNIKPEPGRVKGRKVFKAQKTTQVMNNVNVNVTPKRDELSSQQIRRMEQELNKNGKKDFGRVKTTPRTPPEASRSLKEGSRANVSFVWDHFTKIDQERRVCNHCGETLTVSRGSTWKLRTHIMKEHNDKLSEDYKTTPVPSSQSNMEIKKEIVEKTVQSAKKSSEIQCIEAESGEAPAGSEDTEELPPPRDEFTDKMYQQLANGDGLAARERREAEKEARARNEQQILPPEYDDEYEDDDFDGELIAIYEGHEQQQQGEDMGEEEVNDEESESEDFFDQELIDIYEGHEQEQQGEEVGEEEVNDEEAETTPPASAQAPPDEEILDLIYGSLPPSPLQRRRTQPPSPRTPTLRPSDNASTSFWPPPTVWSRRRRLYEGETGEDSTSKKSKSDLLILC